MVRAISKRHDSKSVSRTEFTPTAANQMLPLVRRIMVDVMRLDRAIAAQREQLRGVDQLPETMDEPNYREELNDIRRSLEDDQRRLDECLSELSALGLETHLPLDGSVDFPAVLNRRAVRLCWHPDDKQVEYWHEVGQPREERQKIDTHKFGLESMN